MATRRSTLPGIGGRFVPSVDDFRVEELPLYLPSGEGEHLYVRFEKSGLTTRDVVRKAARVFGVDDRAIGYAGLKDKAATTVQTISVAGGNEAAASALEEDGIRVLEVARHGNKLKVGHLEGNRFELTFRDVGDDALANATALGEELVTRGLPNFFGEQRFGREGSNIRQAHKVLRRGSRGASSKWKARLLVSAMQSALFNHILNRRLADGTADRVLAGDVMMKVDSGGRFVSEEPQTDQGRFDAFEISISGPMMGHKMVRPAPDSEPARIEAAALAAAGLGPDAFDKVKKLAQGTRRPLRVPVRDYRCTVLEAGELEAGELEAGELEASGLRVAFVLPPGSYATVLAAELVG